MFKKGDRVRVTIPALNGPFGNLPQQTFSGTVAYPQSPCMLSGLPGIVVVDDGGVENHLDTAWVSLVPPR